MPNGTYGGVRGEETKVGQKTFVSRPTRLSRAAGGGEMQREICAMRDNTKQRSRRGDHLIGSVLLGALYVVASADGLQERI